MLFSFCFSLALASSRGAHSGPSKPLLQQRCFGFPSYDLLAEGRGYLLKSALTATQRGEHNPAESGQLQSTEVITSLTCDHRFPSSDPSAAAYWPDCVLVDTTSNEYHSYKKDQAIPSIPANLDPSLLPPPCPILQPPRNALLPSPPRYPRMTTASVGGIGRRSHVSIVTRPNGW